MKIGFLGNTNNYPLRLARAMRALGHEIVFFVDRPRAELRHRPEYHYDDVPYPYPDWIKEIAPLSPIPLALRMGQSRRLVEDLGRCDGAVLNGAALSLAPALSCPVVGLLTGADLDLYADPRHIGALAATPGRFRRLPGAQAVKRLMYWWFVQQQRRGILACRLVEYALPGLLPHADEILDEIGVQKEQRVCFMLSDIESLPVSRASPDGAFRIFCATRLQWRASVSALNLSPLDNKGTDAMLEGLRQFVAQWNRRPVEIHLLRVGIHADEALEHVEGLGLAPYVHWHPELSQRDFLEELAGADAVLENFNAHGALGMAARDAISMGKPVIAWGKSEIFERCLGEPLPILEAHTSSEICARLIEVADRPDRMSDYAMRARAFAARWFAVRRAADRCVEAFSRDG